MGWEVERAAVNAAPCGGEAVVAGTDPAWVKGEPDFIVFACCVPMIRPCRTRAEAEAVKREIDHHGCSEGCKAPGSRQGWKDGLHYIATFGPDGRGKLKNVTRLEVGE
jgi:hypothetical protein